MRRKLSVLVVEDEVLVAFALEALLADHGHRALLARGVERALALAEEASALDLAIVDLQLADGSGARLIGVLRRLRPGLPVIVSTGYALEAAERDALLSTQDRTLLLRKPWDEKELVAALDWAAALGPQAARPTGRGAPAELA